MRIEKEGEDILAPAKHLVFAYYVTDHGFGHATRVVEVVRRLILAGHGVHVVSAAPDFVYTSEIQSPQLKIRKVLLDCGAVQADALTVDRLASLEKYHETAVVPRESILKTEVEWLNSIKADLVVSDVVPVACRAAADAGIRCVCVTNFSWDFIYAEYVMAAGHRHRSIVRQIAEDYSHSEFLIRLPGYCPMPAFRDAIDVPLVVRRLHKSRKQVREELGIDDNVKLLIMNFGGQPSGWKLREEHLPPGWKCLVCGASDKDELPPNFIKLARDAYAPDLIAASDCMLGKIGYGTASEALTYKLPFVFVRRDYFNEERFLRNLLEYHQCGVEMIRRNLFTGHWKPYLDRAMSLKPCYDGDTNGGEMPIREACHVALQKNHPSKHRLWKHAQARQQDKGQGPAPTPVLQIVSYGAELSNRAPTINMDLSDFMDEDKPISYEKARKYLTLPQSVSLSKMTAIYLIFSLLFLSLPFPTLSFRSLTSNSNPCDPTTRPDPRSLRPEKLTVLINGYSEHRIPTLCAISGAYSASPLIAAVVILWGNPSTSVETLTDLSRNLSHLYSAGAPITVLRQESDSLNLRFLPRPWITTRGVLICDDDVEVDPTSIEFAFRMWGLNQDRLIGLFARSHGLDLERRNWIYTVHPDRYSIILTKFMLLNIDYLYLYSCGAQGLENKLNEMRGVVDNMHNCEDILMNFVVADVNKRGPILIGADRVRDWGDARNEVAPGEGRVNEGLSGIKRGRGEHRKRRGECIREFHKILGRMPLRYNYGNVIRSISEQGLCEKGGKLVPCDQQIE